MAYRLLAAARDFCSGQGFQKRTVGPRVAHAGVPGQYRFQVPGQVRQRPHVAGQGRTQSFRKPLANALRQIGYRLRQAIKGI